MDENTHETVKGSIQSQWPPCANNGGVIPEKTTKISTLATKLTTASSKTNPTTRIKESRPIPRFTPCEKTLRAVFEGLRLISFNISVDNFNNNSKVQNQ